jgi:MFS transporter, PPP family, 3-phenylpropionic acid transporter
MTLVMSCLFGTAGVTLVFLPRWLEVERGLDGAAIGAVLSLSQFARLVTGPTLTLLADRAADRRRPLQFIALAALIAYTAFFTIAHDFWSLLVWGFIALSLTQGVTPLVEAAVLRATAEGRLGYGVARGIGSIAFIIANIAGGALVAQFGLGAVVVWILSGLTLFAASAWFGLRPDPVQAPQAPTQGRLGALPELLRSRQFITLIVACGLIQSAHGFYYGFSTLIWRGQGIDASAVGWLWAFGVIVEVAFLWNLGWIERRVSPQTLILLGAVGGVARWVGMGFAPTGFVLWPLQALHALSFAAAHVGAMRLLMQSTPDRATGMAQTLYSALSAGLLMGFSTLLSGILYDHVGAAGYWAMATIALAGGLLALRLREPPPQR